MNGINRSTINDKRFEKDVVLLSLIVYLLSFVSLAHAAALNTAAPKFALANSQRQTRTLSDFKGKVIVVNFWASWCAPCQEELPELNRLAAQYSEKKVRVFPINVDQDRAAARKLLAKLGLQHAAFEILWDIHSKTVSAYNIETMPSSFIVDGHGVIRFIHAGFHSEDPAIWRKEIDSLLR